VIAGILTTIVILLVVGVGLAFAFLQYRRVLREAKNYERGLKMVPLYIHIPPAGDDLESSNGRDERDITDEALSQAQVMYNILASTITKGLKSHIYGQRHISFEIVAHQGLVHYYAVAPVALVETITQAVAAAYPTARLEEVNELNIFNPAGRMSATIGGEFTLRKGYAYPIATYQETKRDAARAMLNALSGATKEDGVGFQFLIRPAKKGWNKSSLALADQIKKDKGLKVGLSGASFTARGMMESLWKPPVAQEATHEEKQLSTLEQSIVDAIEEKTRYPGYDTLIRVIASSNTAARSQALMNSVVSAFSLFDSASQNGFKFTVSKNIEEFVTAYIFRFFPQSLHQNVLNSIELATLFHLPSQSSIPTSQVQRQMDKQVDGPTEAMEEGFLLGYNEFRGVKKPIRLSNNDRRRHAYIIGQTGTGKSKLLENLAFQDMMDGRGFAFIDPHGDSAEALMGMVPKERVEDVIYFSPGDMEMPVGLNLFEFENDDQRDFLIQESIAMLYKLYDPGHTGIVGPRYEHWFRNAALTVMSDRESGSTFIDVPQVFNDQSFTDEKLKHVTDRTVLDFWNKEMAQTSEANKSEVLGWFVSKFGAFLSNEMMRNIIGQTKSGFNLREIMDNKKILLVNLSKGRTGELNSQLLGMIFVMKFQAAAMGRADMPEDQREDFTLYVDEFQNFATDSFESILSEARKYRLSLVLANQFMTQLTDKIREAIIGNIGTVIAGRIGITDAEILQKKFQPTFDAEDLTKLPNFKTITSVMINNVPSAAFSMSLVTPMGQTNPDLRDALKRLSAAKYGRPRAEVEREIFARLGAGDAARKAKMEALKKAQQERMAAFQGGAGGPGAAPATPAAPGSFLDEWLAKRQQLAEKKPGGAAPAPNPAFGPTAGTPPPAPKPEAPAAEPVTEAPTEPAPSPAPAEPVAESAPTPPPEPILKEKSAPRSAPKPAEKPAADPDKLHVREPGKSASDEIHVKLR
jgi:hypothetical protein